jgi:transposase-like protein
MMSQHFLLSPQARTLSLAKVMRMSDDQAYEAFKSIRWAANDGAPVCPKCGGFVVCEFKARRIFKCKACNGQFSVTSGTIFASRKMAIRDILGAIAVFVNGAKGHSALQLSRDLDCDYKTAFVLTHKLREAMSSAREKALSGEVQIDGAYFGGYVKPANRKEDRVDRRLARNQNGKRQVVVVSRLRRAEIGIHHHIAGPYLSAYAAEMGWREDRRRVSNGEQFLAATAAALGHPVSRQWKGYWQRSAA